MKHYKSLWHFAPGAMLFVHVFVVGIIVSATLVKRDPLMALGAFGVTCMVALCITPLCKLLDDLEK